MSMDETKEIERHQYFDVKGLEALRQEMEGKTRRSSELDYCNFAQLC